jgi:hypothetical protein
MMRRTLASESPRPGAGREDTASDFGSWLTRDLRTKGATPEPASTERVKLPASVALNEPGAEFSRWLLADLRPRNSSPPPVDSLAPQTVHEELGIQSPPPDVALDDQDLAVLPRRRQNLRRYGKHAAALLLLLGSLGLVARFSFGPGGRQQASVPAAEAPAMAAAPLPPPAAEAVQVVDEPEPVVPVAQTPGRHSTPVSTSSAVPESGLPDSLVPRGRRSGSAIARFADLPSPTLSRLAKGEQQDAHQHDAAVRAAAKRPLARPAAASGPFP